MNRRGLVLCYLFATHRLIIALTNETVNVKSDNKRNLAYCINQEVRIVTFYENYLKLCNSVGKSPSAVAIELKLGKPSVTRWKHGAVPRDSTVSKIANYFHVPASELIGDDCAEKETAVPKDVGLSPMESQLMEYVRTLTDDQKKMLLAQLQALKNQE